MKSIFHLQSANEFQEINEGHQILWKECQDIQFYLVNLMQFT